MSSCCSGFTCAANQQFDEARARADLTQYRRRGASATTRMLLDGVSRAAGELQSLIDVGAGIGALAHELVETTPATATVVEASESYLQVARDEATRRGISERCSFLHGDFVDLAPAIPRASAVTMDRVVCCYPAFEALLGAGLEHARDLFAFSYPRDRWFVRLVVGVENLMWRIRRSSFRVLVHPPEAMSALADRHGFRLVSRDQTVAWCAEVWQRVVEGAAAPPRAHAPVSRP